ncbi:MAG: hypothetical protein Q9222_002937 [Ikaeria aurantiellina]
MFANDTTPLMSTKRKLSVDQTAAPKRQERHKPELEKTPDTANPAEQYVYIVTETMYGPYMETAEELFEIYATLKDANRRVQTRQEEHDLEDWDEEYDKFGCLQVKGEDDERDGTRFEVRRALVRPPGSVPPLPARNGNSVGDSESQVHDDHDDDSR